jgi:hypothetical protein
MQGNTSFVSYLGTSDLGFREEGEVRLRIEIRPSGLACFLLPEDSVDGPDTCFPYSLHKLLGNSNEKARFRLQEMANGPYFRPAILEKLKGTGVSLTELKHKGVKKKKGPCSCEACTAQKREAMREPGKYVVAQYWNEMVGHVRGVHVLEDGSFQVHDCAATWHEGYGRAGRWSPSLIESQPHNYVMWKLSSGAETNREVIGEDVSFPWSVHKLLDGYANENARNALEKMSKGPYVASDVKDALEGTGVELKGLKNPMFLPGSSYIIGRKSPGPHVFGLRVREDGRLDVYDNLCPSGVEQFSCENLKDAPDNYGVWKLTLPQTTMSTCTTTSYEEQQGVHQHQKDRGRLIIELPIDVKNTTWADALQAACPHIQRAIVHQEHRRSTHFKMTFSEDGKPTVEFDPDFVSDMAPAKHVLSEGEKHEAIHIYLGRRRVTELGIEILVEGKSEQEQAGSQSSLRSLSEYLLTEEDMHHDAIALCSTAEVRIPWSREGVPINSDFHGSGKHQKTVCSCGNRRRQRKARRYLRRVPQLVSRKLLTWSKCFQGIL